MGTGAAGRHPVAWVDIKTGQSRPAEKRRALYKRRPASQRLYALFTGLSRTIFLCLQQRKVFIRFPADPSNGRIVERCRSGRTGRSRKPLCLCGYPGFESLSLRQLPFANSRRRDNSGEIPPYFKGVWLDQANLRDWRNARFRSLNRFRLFPSEPRRIWFGQRKRNVSSRLPIRVDRTFHRSSAARHSIRDTRGGRCWARRCVGQRMRQSLNGASARHC